MKLVNKLMILPMLAVSANAMAAPSIPAAPEVLLLAGAIPTMTTDFSVKPKWREGGIDVSQPMKALNDKDFSWSLGYVWNHAMVGGNQAWPPTKTNYPAWTSNNGAEASPNGDMLAKIPENLQPVNWRPGTLRIIARPMPEELKKTISSKDPNQFLSGTLSTYPYAQTYGVFAITANVPRGKGLWPAFWLMPKNMSWPPEIDIFEVLGANTRILYNTVHYLDAKGNHAQKGGFKNTDKMDLATGWHEYALDWGPAEMKWYLDRKLVFKQPTPVSLINKPCYLIVNMSVGRTTSWGGAPSADTKVPATMMVDSIMAYQRPNYATQVAAK